MNIVFASSNIGKIRELKTLLSNFNFSITPQTELGITDIEETGLTFAENALLKARHASRATGLPAIADDSGLVVAALKGKPGIYSARYAGANATAKDNIQKLLAELRDVPDNNRQAYFYCALVYLAHAEDPTPIICEGIWHGVILKNTRGTQGFGYDPVFYDPKEKCSAAEMPLELKNRISHRGQALQKLVKRIQY